MNLLKVDFPCDISLGYCETGFDLLAYLNKAGLSDETVREILIELDELTEQQIVIFNIGNEKTFFFMKYNVFEDEINTSAGSKNQQVENRYFSPLMVMVLKRKKETEETLGLNEIGIPEND